MAVGVFLLAASGRILGLYELFVLAAGAAGLLVAGAVTVLLGRVDLDARRTLRPARLHAGGESRVELAVRNTGRRSSPVVTIRDSLAPAAPVAGVVVARADGRRHARFLLAPLGPGQEDTASYRLPAERRGVYVIGPLTGTRRDPFGLWSKVRPIAPAVELTVYPAIEPVAAPPHSRGDDPTSGAPRPASVGNTGDDLYGMRPYEVGDDLRRVHWPSTARTGDLMVRQLELPWQGRLTVLLDVRAPAHTDSTFETAVSAAASVVVASWRAGALVRLTTTDGSDSGFAAGHTHFEAVMEHLAVVGRGRPEGLETVVAGLRRAGNGGALTVVTTTAAPTGDLELLAGLQGRFDHLTLVVVEHPRRQRPGVPDVAHRAGATVVRVPAGGRLAPSWDRAWGATLGVGR